MLVAFFCVVVPTKKICILVLVLGELMRSVTESQRRSIGSAHGDSGRSLPVGKSNSMTGYDHELRSYRTYRRTDAGAL